MSGCECKPDRAQPSTKMNKRHAILYFILAALLVLLAAVPLAAQQRGQRGQAAPTAKPKPIRRMPDGKPDISGFYSANAGGANYGLEKHDKDFLTPGTRGV